MLVTSTAEVTEEASDVRSGNAALIVKMAAAKRKRVSKKTKKSWRKNVDIKDVEEFLDEKRFEERTGFIAERLPDEQLFEYHTVGNVEEEQNVAVIKTNRKNVGGTYRLREDETPKCFEILERRSAVEDPIKKRNRLKTREEKRHPAVKRIFQERLEKGILTQKQKVSLRDRKRAEEARKRKPKIPEFKFDIWSKDNNKELDSYAAWLRDDTVRHNLANTGNKIVKPPKSIVTKTSGLPAIENPHPGTSYNPSIKAQTELLQIVAHTEMGMVKEEKHLKRVTTDMFSKVNRAEAEKEWMKEMSACLVVSNDEEDNEEAAGDYTTVNPPVKNKKKTLQKRRRLREASQLQAKLRQKKIEKKKISDIHKLKKLNAAIKKREAEIKKQSVKREKLKKLKQFKTKKLSHTKFEEPLPDFNLTEEISGNLRGVKSTVNLLMDRYKSLQKRNILEPSIRRFPKKVKRKRYERECTKMGWEPKGY